MSKKPSRSCTASVPSPYAELSESETSDWDESCAKCGSGGDLLCCEYGKSCRLAYHLSCVGLTVVPSGEWICPKHSGASDSTPTSNIRRVSSAQSLRNTVTKVKPKSSTPSGRPVSFGPPARLSRSCTPQPQLQGGASDSDTSDSQSGPPVAARLRQRRASSETFRVETDSYHSSDFEERIQGEFRPNKRGSGAARRGSSAPAVELEEEDYCSGCGRGGELLCCEFEGCNRGFHMNCVGLSSIPEGTWICPVHADPDYPVYVRPPPSKKKQCHCCSSPFEVVLSTPLPKLANIMLAYNLCSKCLDQLSLEFQSKNSEVESFLVSSVNKGALKDRKYFVKWKELSHRKCSWISRAEAVWVGRTKLNRFDTKMDEMQPADFQELLKTRGLESEWLDMDRILDEDVLDSDSSLILVKWKGLGYDCATWEELSGLSSDERHLYDAYKIRLSDHTEPKAKEPPKKKFAIFDVQPDFLTGGTLHAYQLEGLNWLRFKYNQGTNAILADEMGLGKTVQVVSYAASLAKSAREDMRRPILIVAPLSCIAWWVREFNRWAPFMDCLALTGRETSRAAFWNYEVFPSSGKRGKNRALFDVLVTSFEIARIDVSELKRLSWNVIAIDEGHRLKSSSSALLESLVQLDSQHRVVITGTPLQNNLAELMNLMQFVDENVYRKLKSSHQESDLKNPSSEQITLFQELLGPYLLRRMKADVRDAVKIPPKFEVIVPLDLSQKQRASYKGVLQRSRSLLVNGKSNALSNIVMSLRNVCNHNYLIEEACIRRPSLDDLLDSSSKLQFLDQFLPVLKESGRRILIFSQFVTMLDIISQYLDLKNISFGRIDGTVPSSQRQKSIDIFNSAGSDQHIFLLSTRAGGLGLNLATADTVVMYDSDWNPHADLQALSRCHRIGQEKIVMIYRLVCKFSVEERIVMVGKKKLALEHAVVSGLSKKEKENDSDGKPTKDELLQILQSGAEQLFGERSSEKDRQPRVWDAAGAKKLLSQSLTDAAEAAVEEEKSSAATEEEGFFAAFKHAKIWSFDEQELGDLEGATPGAEQSATAVSSSDFWSKILPEEAPVPEEVLPVNEAGYSMRKRKAVDYRDTMNALGGRFADQDPMKFGAAVASDSSESYAKPTSSEGSGGDDYSEDEKEFAVALDGKRRQEKNVSSTQKTPASSKSSVKRPKVPSKADSVVDASGNLMSEAKPSQIHLSFSKCPDFICIYQTLQQSIPVFDCFEQFCDPLTPWDTPTIVQGLNAAQRMDHVSLRRDTMLWLNVMKERFLVSAEDVGNRLYGHNPQWLTFFKVFSNNLSSLTDSVAWSMSQSIRSYIGGLLSCCIHGGLPPFNVQNYSENLALFQKRLTSRLSNAALHSEANLMVKFAQTKLLLLDTLAWLKFTCDHWKITHEQLVYETGIDASTFKLIVDNFEILDSKTYRAISLLRSCLNATNHFKCLPSKALRSFPSEICHFCREPLKAYKVSCASFVFRSVTNLLLYSSLFFMCFNIFFVADSLHQDDTRYFRRVRKLLQKSQSA
jgi:SNF2 family DNA or RNA helicase